MCLVFLATEWGNLPTRAMVSMLVATGIFSFMFAFRRGQRLRMEARYEAEMRELEEMEEEDDDVADRDEPEAEAPKA
ncbi:MAG: hypothetical protein D6722_14805 [Bacteroidetes bacterium]|nr:MAG: hypothetical protein D6722_14805 [Bacteroidota bacterium]